MGWTSPVTWIANQFFTAAEANEQIRDNLEYLYPNPVDAAGFAALTPFDGMQAVVLVDAANGIEWRFIYRASDGGSFKWHFIGGAPLHNEVQAAETNGPTFAYGDLPTVGPAITVPFAGEYEVGGMVRSTAEASGISVASPSLGGATPVDENGGTNAGGNVGGAGNLTTVPFWVPVASLAAGALVKLQYKGSSVTVNSVFGHRKLWVRPIRVAA